MVLRQAVFVILVGILAGIAASALLTRYMRGLLFEVKTSDVSVFALISVVMAVVALSAALGPAARAARVDPNIALRYE